MKHSKIVRVGTLSLFLCLISAFVLFKTGWFDGYYTGAQPQGSHNGGTLVVPRDTIFIPRLAPAMYSSKSGFISSPVPPQYWSGSLNGDEVQKQKKGDTSSKVNPTPLMSGSKSIIIIEHPPSVFPSLGKNVIRKDSL